MQSKKASSEKWKDQRTDWRSQQGGEACENCQNQLTVKKIKRKFHQNEWKVKSSIKKQKKITSIFHHGVEKESTAEAIGKQIWPSLTFNVPKVQFKSVSLTTNRFIF